MGSVSKSSELLASSRNHAHGFSPQFNNSLALYDTCVLLLPSVASSDLPPVIAVLMLAMVLNLIVEYQTMDCHLPPRCASSITGTVQWKFDLTIDSLYIDERTGGVAEHAPNVQSKRVSIPFPFPPDRYPHHNLFLECISLSGPQIQIIVNELTRGYPQT